jgi:hypothetical protein
MDAYDVAPGLLDLSTPPPAAPGSQQQHHQHADGLAAAAHDPAVQMQQHESLQDQQHTQQPQEDYLTASLKQQLLQDVSSFFQADIAPRSLSISEVTSITSIVCLVV